MRPARGLPALVALLLAAVMAGAPPAGADDLQPAGNNAVAINTEDGASVFRLAFSVKMAANGVVDQGNHAWALASCTDCETVALAFQVVLVWNDPDVVVPHNQALALNDQCRECLTYAAATQIVLGFDGPVRFTDEGRRRLTQLRQTLRSLEDRIGEMSPAELVAAVTAAKQELVSIVSQELVQQPVRTGEPAVGSTTTAVPAEPTTASTAAVSDAGSSTTTTAPAPDSRTSTTSAAATTTTTATTTSSAATTTTDAPVTTTTTAATTSTTGGG